MFGFHFGPTVPSMSPQDLAAKLQADPNTFIVDVRERNEYQAGHIPGSRHIPLGELQSRAKELPKDRELHVICLSGNRSKIATTRLLQEGYRAINVRPGMMAWRGPVEKATASSR